MSEKTVDASRPFFHRKEGEVGVYVKIYDAKAENAHAIGSEQYYRMDLMDKLFDIYQTADVIKMKAALDRKKMFQGAYLERFEKGIILAVGFDDIDALENVWKLHKDEKLQRALQDVLMTPSILKSLGATNITLWIKMMEDEYTNCKNELLCRKMGKVNVTSLPSDVEVLKRLKKYQEKLSKHAQDISDTESSVEHRLGEFLLTMKQILPTDVTSIKTLKEFETYHKVAKGANKKTASLDAFANTLKQLRATFTEIEASVCNPLLQIHKSCENEKQRELKKKISITCIEAQALLKPEVDLTQVTHKDWQKKVLQREQELYRGLICVIPLACSAVMECSFNFDEYLLDFPSQVYK
ncbi:uncharacterized protein LOC110443545 [Mizuhopecten yessoensis]|uniref:Uncharacterized protein n=1 Tax=Mizuhopecten yessoensis TaxID=6573 RepID=A0A210PEQ3_MIZYE|nr:uncharacterized protein LOC110443545 [Mizuhopecten yessoensis]XP_021343491.1 uncharacterized protein LOC110443545 [Mizuhopecten yessoensis]XP_021343492.1 uncharacterized protein LOC110443545 [Mizuhopecten yessoensis]XP_021343493.1 uncharacterized protein LOC110443545 [Mizuhopecten yessoensis]OWF34965.1 hypothetical protein KP79_PYT23554 [Mizuhopecten yessoensis]